jgi:capsular exopolysaccharide synthesis family protein
MTPDENSSNGDNGAGGKSTTPFGSAAPFGTASPFGSSAPFGTTSPFGSTAPFGVASPFDAGRAAPSADVLFTDPKAVIKKALLIIRSRWLIGLVAAILVGSGAGMAIFRFRPIESTAETTLLAQSPLDQILNSSAPGAEPVVDERQESALMNHLSVMLSHSFQQKVAESFTPAERVEIQRPYLKPGQQPSMELLETLLAKKIDVEREREREFFTVKVKHISPGTALMIANHFTASYLLLVQSELHRANRVAADLLGKRASDLTSEIQALEDERRDYRKEHNLISPEENQVILEDRIKEVNLARSDLRVQRAKLEAEVRQARDDLAKSPLPFTNSVLSAYAGMQPLRLQLDALEVQRDVLAVRYGPNHSKMQEAEGGITATRDALARDYQMAFADLESQLDVAISAENGLNAEFDKAFNESLELSRLASHLNALGQEADGKRKTLDDLYQRIGKTSIDTALPADVLRVIDPGFIHYPLVPIVAIYGAIIGFLALCAFAGAPLAINFFDERINENVDLESRLRIEVIGVLPRLSRTRKEDRPHIVRDNVDMAYAEAFLSFASQIDLISKKAIPRRILITSTLPGEGKSTVASNLAAAYTRLGRRTVLVDCDFRKPSQRNFHKIGGDSGLLAWAMAGFHIDSGLLLPGGPIDATMLPDGTMLVPAGASDHQPARYLIADGMARFFALLRQEFEIVIVDTPPAGVFQDALIAARNCDETIFVARDGKANTAQLHRVLYDFSKTSAPAVGLILNAFSPNANHPQLAYFKMSRKYGYSGPAPRKAAAATATR